MEMVKKPNYVKEILFKEEETRLIKNIITGDITLIIDTNSKKYNTYGDIIKLIDKINSEEEALRKHISE